MTLQVRGSTGESNTCIFRLSGRRFNQFLFSINNNEIIYQLKGLVCKETVVLRRWVNKTYTETWFYQPTELIIKANRELRKIDKLTFRLLALC